MDMVNRCWIDCNDSTTPYQFTTEKMETYILSISKSVFNNKSNSWFIGYNYYYNQGPSMTGFSAKEILLQSQAHGIEERLKQDHELVESRYTKKKKLKRICLLWVILSYVSGPALASASYARNLVEIRYNLIRCSRLSFQNMMTFLPCLAQISN
ncbi:hypothetical protein BD560DRAFT_419836 [Blakeslea trispora]|nr:hypothetical protein BD560DRAFT_419836 [Blakeslea trispora]